MRKFDGAKDDDGLGRKMKMRGGKRKREKVEERKGFIL
jgi:hypothetical protein